MHIIYSISTIHELTFFFFPPIRLLKDFTNKARHTHILPIATVQNTMDGCHEYHGLLLGLVEVKQGLGNLDKADRVMVTQKCYSAVKAETTADATWTGKVEKFDEEMEVKLDTGYINILTDNKVVCRSVL